MSVGAALLGAATVLLGTAGVAASACIYRVPSRPAWNSPFTLIQFGLTAAVLGPLFAAAMGLGDRRWLTVAAVAGAAAQLLAIAVAFVRMVDAVSAERRATARLLSTVLAPRFVVRGTLLAFGGIVLPLTGTGAATAGVALVIAVVSEILGRYLFFVSVVPKHLAAPYVAAAGEAA
jgi:DMSO reductase anchor subunit